MKARKERSDRLVYSHIINNLSNEDEDQNSKISKNQNFENFETKFEMNFELKEDFTSTEKDLTAMFEKQTLAAREAE